MTFDTYSFLLGLAAAHLLWILAFHLIWQLAHRITKDPS